MTEILAHADAESAAERSRASTVGSTLPLPTRVLFWRARHLRNDPFVHHLPFAFWLVETLAPRRIVTLGVGSGVAYFGLAQAVDRLGLACKCLGFGNWEDGVPDALAEHNARNYEEFSRLEAAATVSDIARRIPKGSVDLLLIDTALDAEAIAALTHEWPAKISQRGVVLIHRPARLAESSEGHAFHERLHHHYAVIPFPGGEGLETILYGPRQPDRLRRLAELESDDPDRMGVEAVFARLGWGHYHEWAAAAEVTRARKARDEAASLRKRTEAAEAAAGKALAALEARSDQIAQLQVRAFDRENALEEKLAAAETSASKQAQVSTGERDARAQAETALAAAHGEVEQQKTELRAERDARKAAEAKSAELETALQTRFREIADLTAAFEAARKAAADRETALAAAHGEVEQQKTELRAERDARKAAEAKSAELETALQTRFREIADLTAAFEAARKAAKADEARLQLLLTLKAAQARLRLGRGDPFRNTGLLSLKQQLRILRTSEQFDPEWYLAIHTDVKSAGLDPAEHYLRYGTYEGRDPGPNFNTLAYYDAHREAAEKGIPALVHLYTEAKGADSGPWSE